MVNRFWMHLMFDTSQIYQKKDKTKDNFKVFPWSKIMGHFKSYGYSNLILRILWVPYLSTVVMKSLILVKKIII